MATKIVTKNSSTASAVPTASDLVQGELAVNVADKRLFTEDNGGAIVELGTNPSTIDINAGTIDGTAIGASSASTGAFTTLTATGAFTSRGIDDNADATAITIDSSENVGIGTASPSSYYSTTLVVDAPDEDGITVVSPTTGTGYLMFADGTSGNERYRGYINYGHANDDMQFATSGLTRMRIDSSGNVLVGTTSTDPAASSTETGVALKGGGFVSISRNDTAASVNINKVFYDGSIVDFRKNGTTVGSIGTRIGDLLIGTGDTGLQFVDEYNEIIPRHTNGNNIDATIQLGASSSRFTNLYLSGGVYLGGTGAANKLDDYEEGTFTPTSPDVTLTSPYSTSRYRKIGSLVYVTYDFVVPVTSATQFLKVNTPFAAVDYGSGSLGWTDSSTDLLVHVNTSGVSFRKNDGSGDYRYADLSGKRFIFTVLFTTTA